MREFVNNLLVIKFYQKPNKPEFMALIRQVGNSILVNYPLDKPYRKRSAKWVDLDSVYIEWVKEFAF